MPTRTSAGAFQNANREVRRVLGIVDADGGYGNAGRYLHGREQRVEAIQRAHGEWDANHGQVGERRRESGKRGRQASARDYNLESLLAGGLDQLAGLIGLAVRGGRMEFVGDAGFGQDLECGLDPRFIGFRSDENQYVGHNGSRIPYLVFRFTRRLPGWCSPACVSWA